MGAEIGARRRRQRAIFGDRGQSLVDFLVLVGLGAGSLGLFARPWMAAAAPWGFTLPFVYAAGILLIEWRRQKQVAAGADPAVIGAGYDWVVLIWSFACAILAAAAFFIAWGAEPLPPPDPDFWEPPETAVDSTLDPAQP